MVAAARAILAKAWLLLLRRRELDSVMLRRFFRDHYDIDVGLYSYGCFDRWRMPGPLRIGRYCSVARTVRSAPGNHPFEALTTHPLIYEKSFGAVDDDVIWTKPLVIEDDVWIGHHVMIVPGCKHIGRGAVIGAGSVVTHDVPAYAVVAGNPARKLRDRFPPELCAAIEASRWWDLSLVELAAVVRGRPELIYHPTQAAIARWIETGRR